MLMDPSPMPPGLLQQHALPRPVTDVAPVPPPAVLPSKPPKHFLAAFFLNMFLGVFGADRFYLGQYGYALLKFLTFGWFGIGVVIDGMLIMNGSIRDSHGNKLVGYEYRGLAKRLSIFMTVSGIAVLLLIIIAGIVLVPLVLSSSRSLTGLSGAGGATSSSGLKIDQPTIESLLLSL